MKQKAVSKYNTIKFGLFVGLLLPAIGIFAFYESRYAGMSLSEFIKTTISLNVSSALLSLALLPNLAAFFIFLQMYNYLTSRGILMATFILAILGFVLKFVVS